MRVLAFPPRSPDRARWLLRPQNLWFDKGRRRTFCRLVRRFVEAFGEGLVERRSTGELERLVRDGRLVCIIAEPREGRPFLAGVSICREHARWPGLFEVSMTVVRPDRRRRGLASALVRSLTVQECSEYDAIRGVINTTRADNAPCLATLRGLGAEPGCPGALAPLSPELADFIVTRLAETRLCTGAALAILAPRTVRDGARMLLQARTGEGFPLGDGAPLRLGPGWNDPGFFSVVEAMDAGWLPAVDLWRGGGPGRLSA